MFVRSFSLVLLCATLLPCAGTPAPAAERPLLGRVFVVDPGHGVRTPGGAALNVGAVGPDGIQEQHVNLLVGDDLAALLRGAGARVVMTRTDAQPYRIATDRRRDNRARAALANRLGATAFIALHCDSSLNHAQRGTSIFWLRENSAPLARAIRAHLRSLDLGEAAFHPRDLAVTSEARVPAVLVELGFISNPSQERLLASPDFQQREARALFEAITAVFATNRSPTATGSPSGSPGGSQAQALRLQGVLSGAPHVNPNGDTVYIKTSELDVFSDTLTYPQNDSTPGLVITGGVPGSFGPMRWSGPPPAGQLLYTIVVTFSNDSRPLTPITDHFHGGDFRFLLNVPYTFVPPYVAPPQAFYEYTFDSGASPQWSRARVRGALAGPLQGSGTAAYQRVTFSVPVSTLNAGSHVVFNFVSCPAISPPSSNSTCGN